MIPVLFLISVISFAIIELPEGDYLSQLTYEMELSGDMVSLNRLARLRNRYGLDDPVYVRYWKWISGWFQGDFGESFVYNLPVREVIGSRMLLTVVISISTMLFTYLVSIPIGIYSATHKYSFLDYVFTIIGFLGLSVPNFLLALVLIVIWAYVFNQPVGGLFSSQFTNAPWSLAKVWDLAKHMWIPIVVIGTSGTAGMIRIMRANLLDILGHQYIKTAYSKGLKDRVVIYKHAVRVAINPIISMFGMSLPNVVSGETITAIVLNLPTVGPLLHESLVSRDMYLAGTLIMLLAIFLQIGNLIADFLLALVDPRIKFE